MKAKTRERASITRLALGTALLLALALVGGIGAPAGGQSSSQLKQQQQRADYRKRLLQRRLRITKQQQQALVRELSSARADLNVARQRLRSAQQQLDATRATLRQTRAEHAAARKEYEKESSAFGDRLRALYQRGANSYLAVVLESESFSDFTARTYLTQRVVESDVETVRRIRARKIKLEMQQTALEQQERAEARYRTQVQAQTAAVERHTARVSAAKMNVDGQRKRLEQQFAQLDAESKQIASLLRRMLQSSSLRYTGPSRWTGQYYMPVRNGNIRSGFGNRYHPILRRWRKHTGVDITASTRTGTPIHAAADGLVVSAQYRGGYGNTVIIDHGGGIHTLYAHCRKGRPFAVRAGQTVKRGQIIAYMGSTGLSTGPHVHFEVRRNGTPINPMR